MREVFNGGKKHHQSYITFPEKECVDRDYELYLNAVKIIKIPIYSNDCDKLTKFDNNKEKNDLINSHVDKIIFSMEKYGHSNYSISFDDALIIIDRIVEDDDLYYEISVANQDRIFISF